MSEQQTKTEEFALPVLVPMEPIPAGSNPYHHDLYHMGCDISGNWEAMFDKHVGDIDPSYIIMINKKTGQRFKMVFKFNKDHGDLMNAVLRQREAEGKI